MNHHVVRRFAGVSLLVVLIILTAAACGSSGHQGPAAKSQNSASTSADALACHKVQSTLAAAPSTLGRLAMHPASAEPAVKAFVARLNQDVSGATPHVQQAVHNFGANVQKVLMSLRTTTRPNTAMITSHLTQAADGIVRACRK